MNTATVISQTPRCFQPQGWKILILGLVLAVAIPLFAGAAPGVAAQASEAIGEAGNSAVTSAEQLWQRIDERRLKNRTPDEIAAWVIMGILVGAVAGLLTLSKFTGLGTKLGRLLLGLAGAFLGGLIVHLAKIDFGMGLVLIRYEELLFSFVGAVVLILLARFIRPRPRS